MNIWQFIVTKFSALLIIVGIINPVQPAPVIPEIVVPNNQEVIEMSVLEENSPADEYVVEIKKKPTTTQTNTSQQVTTDPTPQINPEPIPTQIIQVYIPQQVTTVSEPVKQPEPIAQPKPIMNTLQIINPYPGKGLGRTYKANAEIVDESNYIDIGLLVKTDNGEYLHDVVVEVEATDSSQNKTLNGTGNVTNIYPDGVKTTVHYYPFHYEFKNAGEHIITFKQGNLTESVTLQVSE